MQVNSILTCISGTVYHILKVDPKVKELVMEIGDRAMFTEIVIAGSMYTDHMPTAYEAALQTLLEGPTLK